MIWQTRIGYNKKCLWIRKKYPDNMGGHRVNPTPLFHRTYISCWGF